MSSQFLIADIPVELRHNPRRRTRIAVDIDPAGHVVLDAPSSTSQAEAEAIVQQHARWLRVRLNRVKEETAHLRPMGYGPGEVVLYLGEPLRLEHHAADDVVAGDGVLRVPFANEQDTRKRVRDWYRGEADVVFGEVLQSFAELPWLLGRLPTWRHRFMKSQWGSCSAKGTISLNTHLVRTPVRLIEYVALHELCHLKHHNHSRRFHALMAMHMPDADVRGKELRRNLSLLLDETSPRHTT